MWMQHFTRTILISGLGFPTLLIPWVVLQELDYLKSGKLSSKVEYKARPAVHYIYSCLKNQEPRLVGQSMQQASRVVGEWLLCWYAALITFMMSLYCVSIFQVM